MIAYWRFIRDNGALLGFGFLAFFFGNFGQSFFIAWFGTPIQQNLGLSASAYSLTYSTATLGSALCIIVVGSWIDRMNLAAFVFIVGAGLCLAMVMLANSVGFWSLTAAFLLLRLCGQGLMPHTGMSTMARYFVQGRGKAMSIASTGTPLGEMVLPVIVVLILGWVGWRGSWWLFAALVPLVFAPLMGWLLWRIRRRYPLDPVAATASAQSDDNAVTTSWRRRDVLRDVRFWLVLPVMLAGPFIVTGIFIHQGFLVSARSWTAEWFALAFTVYGLMHWLGSLGTGVLVDRFSARAILRFYMLPMGIGLLMLAFADGQWLAFTFMFLAGTSIGAGSPIMGALWAEVYGVRHIGAIRSLVTAFMVFSTAASPVLIGVAIDAQVSLEALLLAALAYLVVAVLLAQIAFARFQPDQNSPR